MQNILKLDERSTRIAAVALLVVLLCLGADVEAAQAVLALIGLPVPDGAGSTAALFVSMIGNLGALLSREKSVKGRVDSAR